MGVQVLDQDQVLTELDFWHDDLGQIVKNESNCIWFNSELITFSCSMYLFVVIYRTKTCCLAAEPEREDYQPEFKPDPTDFEGQQCHHSG